MVTAVASLPAERSSSFAEAFTDAACRHHGRVVARGAWLGAAFPTARAAVACALEVRRRWTAENHPAEARLALHAGEVVDAGGELLGEGIVTAAALASAVTVGDVWCTGQVRELAASLPGVDFVSQGYIEAHPMDRPLAVFRLAELEEAAPARAPLVGRDRERAELRQLLHRALLGRGELVLLTGGAGVGKTYLAEDLATEAGAFGARVLTGRCRQDATLPYLPFVELLDVLLPDLQDPEHARQVLADDAPQLAKIMPRLRTLLPDIPAPLDLPPEQERRFLFQAVHAVVARLAETRPLVLVVEDVHCRRADPCRGRRSVRIDSAVLSARSHAIGRRRMARVQELERILATAVDLVEVFDVATLAAAMESSDVRAVALDSSEPDGLAAAVAAAGARPVLRPLWRRERNSRGEIDELFDGYGLLTAGGIERLADGQLSTG